MFNMRRVGLVIGCSLSLLALWACAPSHSAEQSALSKDEQAWVRRTPDGPWSQGVGYSLFLRSFADSDGDGKGDLRGATAKLDYLNDLGVRNIWLLPIHPSPSYHKYDVSDYVGVDTIYGNLDDFSRFAAQAHKRGIRVTIDFVANHCSRQHEWFKAAIADTASPYYDWFVWQQPGDTAKREWHRVRGRPELPKYYGFFWAGMPDLNLDNPAVRAELIRSARVWLDRGVDGFRLDAAQHVYDHLRPEGRAKSIAWWKEFRDSLRTTHPKVYLIGEVWNRPEIVRDFYQALDGCFNFGLAEAMVQQIKSGRDTSGLIAAHTAYQQSLPTGASDCVFLSNHDQVRVASRLGENAQQEKDAATLLFAQGGMPWIYYAEELGAPGKKPDPNLREPMPWGEGDTLTTRWITPTYIRADRVRSVREQQADPNSLLSTYQRLGKARAPR